MSKWIDKWKNWFFGGEDTEESSSIAPKERTVPLPIKEIEGRVQHIYPKAGAYRFPLSVHNEQDVRLSAAPVRQRREKSAPSIRSERKLFQGKLVQSKETPSPVYGFQKGRKVAKEEIKQGKNEERYSKREIHAEETYVEEKLNEEMLNIEERFDQEGSNIEENFYEEETSHGDVLLSVEDEGGILSKTAVYPVEEDEWKEEEFKANLEERWTEVPHPELTKTASSPLPAEVHSGAAQTKQGFENSRIAAAKAPLDYHRPSLSFLNQENWLENEEESYWVDQQADLLMETFQHFNLKADLIGVTQGPTVTRFEIQPAPGIKISKFTNLQDDLKLSLAAKEIRIEAPIPGKHAIGIEVPNLQAKPVLLGNILSSKVFQESASPLTVCLGADLSGDPVVTDIQKMPHGLIAGSTGSGKSVCINSILVSLLYKSTPEQLRLLLIDPKVVELSPYQSVPHLVTPVVTDPKKANAALKWAVEEMERRYQLFADEGVRDINRYNQVLAAQTGEEYTLPYIVIIIDELADLMMVAPQDVEESICRITQKARACGIHLIVATQRPSVDVITGLIKANIPTRLAFSVSSQVDSRTILDMAGAERLLGKGDMLFLPNGAAKPFRLQGNFVSDEEIERVVMHVSAKDQQHFLFSQDELSITKQEEIEDELIEEAAFYVMEQGIASASSLQRKFRIGYNRAARMIDWMEEQGMITESLGSKGRNVVWSQEQFLNWLDKQHGK